MKRNHITKEIVKMEDVYYLKPHVLLTKEHPVIFHSLFKELNMANAQMLDMKNHGVQLEYMYLMEWFVMNVGKMKLIHGDTVFLVEMMKTVSHNHLF